MRLAWLEARDFRNYRELSVEIGEGLTALVGENAQGKTNLLEAMYYLCAMESPRVSADAPLVWSVERRPGGRAAEQPVEDAPTSAFLRGEVESASGRALIEIEVRSGGQNRTQVNRSAVRRKRDLRRHARAVFSEPDDLRIVHGDPDHRRRFLDDAVRTLWPIRDGVASAYERTLRQRNRLLKDWPGPGSPPGIEGWDAELVANGTALTIARRRAVEAIAERASAEFEALSGQDREALVVRYRPSVDAADEDVGSAFVAGLAERRGDELVRRTTLVGPHRDALEMNVQGLGARGFASHGETWASALCLRLALADAVAAELGEPPILFLDDPFSGLDPVRRGRLSARLASRGQVLIAIPDESQLPSGAAVWCVREGTVRVAPAGEDEGGRP